MDSFKTVYTIDDFLSINTTDRHIFINGFFFLELSTDFIAVLEPSIDIMDSFISSITTDRPIFSRYLSKLLIVSNVVFILRTIDGFKTIV